MKSNMKILIDADACPVRSLAVSIASEHKLEVTLFSDTAHIIPSDSSYVKSVTVDKGADSADFVILSHCQRGDLVITGDYALAAMCLSKGAYALRPDGTEYTDLNISLMLDSRYIAQKIRSSGGRLPKIKKRTAEDDKNFERAMRALLSRLENS